MQPRMSREENNRYLRQAVSNQFTQQTPLKWLGARPFRKLFILWAVLLALYGGFFVLFSNPTAAPGDTPSRAPSNAFSPFKSYGLGLVVALVVVGGALVVRRSKIQKALQKEARVLQHPDVSAYLQFVDELIPANSPIPDAALYRAQRRALAHVLYGQPDRARHELNGVSWQGKAPVLQSMERLADALLHLLCKDDPERAHALATEALSMTDMSSAIPGAQQGRVIHDVTLRGAEARMGTLTPDGMASLKRHHQESQLLLVRLVSAWGLRAAASHTQDASREEAMRQFLQTHAPHCVALTRASAA
jgi:hypothetical protein